MSVRYHRKSQAHQREEALFTMLALLAVIAAASTFIIFSLQREYERNIPLCQEDQVLVGAGHFERMRWDRYVCGPALDDYMPEEGRDL